MISPHLGTRVSALLDGQLPADEADRAWAHVHGCHACRDLIEREGWIKTRLSGLCYDPASSASEGLKGRLKQELTGPCVIGVPPGDVYLTLATEHRARRGTVALAAIGGGAVGAAVVGVLAFGASPSNGPGVDRQPTVTIRTPVEQVYPGLRPARRLVP